METARMATPERFAYRGYDLLPKRQWECWCVSIYPRRSDVPLLAQSALQILRQDKQAAVDEAKKAIDLALDGPGAKVA